MTTASPEMREYEVVNGKRRIRFEGELLATSTSWEQGADRWVEFALYRTASGNYVLSRIGRSVLYHLPECSISQRNHLEDSVRSDLPADAVPCMRCQPHLVQNFPAVCLERQRYWGQVCDSAEAVIASLERLDSSGARYMTNVSQRLVEAAGEIDPDIDRAYRVEVVS